MLSGSSIATLVLSIVALSTRFHSRCSCLIWDGTVIEANIHQSYHRTDNRYCYHLGCAMSVSVDPNVLVTSSQTIGSQWY